MSNWINFAEIRQKVSLEDVLFRFYRFTTLKRDGDKVAGPCPVHGGDSPRAFQADLSKNVWHCFSQCKKGGNQIDFVAAKEGISIRDAALKLQAFFLSGTTPAAPTPPAPSAPASGKGGNGAAPPESAKREEEEEENPVLTVKLDLKGDHPHLVQDRSLQLSTVQHFGIGYCSRGIMRGTIAIPIHDEEGELVAYAGRRLKPSDIREFGKYKFPKGFKKERVLYNLSHAKVE
jgi:DNA primase